MLGWEPGPPKEGHCGGGGLFPQGSGGAGTYNVPWARDHWISQVPKGNVTEDDLEGSVLTSGLLRRTEAQTPNWPLDWLILVKSPDPTHPSVPIYSVEIKGPISGQRQRLKETSQVSS